MFYLARDAKDGRWLSMSLLACEVIVGATKAELTFSACCDPREEVSGRISGGRINVGLPGRLGFTAL